MDCQTLEYIIIQKCKLPYTTPRDDSENLVRAKEPSFLNRIPSVLYAEMSQMGKQWTGDGVLLPL